MGLKRYGTDGAWREVENVRRYAAGAGWQDAEFVRRWDGTKWADCWNRFDPTAIWRAAELLYGVSRNRNSTGNVSIPGYALTNPCYTFCFCATTMTIYRWDGSELTRIYNNNTDYRAFLSGRHRDGCHYLCASAMEGSTTNSGQVYGGAIAVFSFPGIKTETLDAQRSGPFLGIINRPLRAIHRSAAAVFQTGTLCWFRCGGSAGHIRVTTLISR